MPVPAPRLIDVSADWLTGNVPAYSFGNHWNGWAVPYFTADTAALLALEWNALGMDGTLRHDEARDAYVFSHHDADGDEIFPAETIYPDGVPTKVYGIGAMSWCWYDMEGVTR